MDNIPQIQAFCGKNSIFMKNAAERLAQYADFKGYKISEAESIFGMTRGYLKKQRDRNAGIGEMLLRSVVVNCPDINPEWLLTGNGTMLRSTNNSDQEIGVHITEPFIDKEIIKLIHHPKSTEQINEEQVVYLYNIEATAGLREILDNKTQNILDAIIIPDLPKCDGAIRVTGDSMYPILKSGDIVLFKEVTDMKYVFWGEMYLLSISVDDEEYITVKYIQRSSEGTNHIKLVSHNPHHDPKDIPLASVRAIALVKASIRLHTII